MRCYLALGRSEEAVRLFERVKRSLLRELSIEPVTALMEMRERARLSSSEGGLSGQSHSEASSP